jgi:transcriptional regulator with XRE-family HTH domain
MFNYGTMNTAMAAAATSVGPRIRALRQMRGLSQFELASRAGFSVRHISFIETGRAQPSREAVLALGEVLELPLRERNRLLESAGFVQVFRETSLSAGEMEHMRGVLQFILDRHLPYAAVVLDRHWNSLLENHAASQFFSALISPALSAKTKNILRVTFHPEGTHRWIVNWPEVERHLLRRAELQLGSVDDPVGTALLAEIRAYTSSSEIADSHSVFRPSDLLLPIHIRTGEFELRLFSTIMTLCRPQDVTLQELRVETWFPADQESEDCWQQNFGNSASQPQFASALSEPLGLR